MIWTLPQRLAALAGMLSLALAVGFGAGYYTSGQFTKAAVVEQQGKAIKQAGTNIVQSVEKSQKVEASIQQSDNQIDQLMKAAQTRLQKGKAHVEPSIHPGSDAGDANGASRLATSAGTSVVEVRDRALDCAGNRLDVGTVRLLNRARDESALESTASGAR